METQQVRRTHWPAACGHVCVSFLCPLYFLILILLIKLWESARLTSPSPSPQLSHREHKGLEEAGRGAQTEQGEEPESANRGGIHGGSASLLISILPLWMKLFRGAPRPSIPNTPPKPSLNPHCVCAHTYTHVGFISTTNGSSGCGDGNAHQWMQRCRYDGRRPSPQIPAFFSWNKVSYQNRSVL